VITAVRAVFAVRNEWVRLPLLGAAKAVVLSAVFALSWTLQNVLAGPAEELQ